MYVGLMPLYPRALIPILLPGTKVGPFVVHALDTAFIQSG